MQGNVNLAPGCSISGQHKCDVCPSQFPLKEDLIVHQLLFHSFTGAKPPTSCAIDVEGALHHPRRLHPHLATDVRSLNPPVPHYHHHTQGLTDNITQNTWTGHNSRIYPPTPSIRPSSLPYPPHHSFGYADRPHHHDSTVDLVHGTQASGQYKCDRCGCQFTVREDLTVHHLLYHNTNPTTPASYQTPIGNPRHLQTGVNNDSPNFLSLPGGRHLQSALLSGSTPYGTSERNPHHFGSGFAQMQSGFPGTASREYSSSNVSHVQEHGRGIGGEGQSNVPSMYGRETTSSHLKALDLTYSDSTTYSKELHDARRNYTAPSPLQVSAAAYSDNKQRTYSSNVAHTSSNVSTVHNVSVDRRLQPVSKGQDSMQSNEQGRHTGLVSNRVNHLPSDGDMGTNHRRLSSTNEQSILHPHSQDHARTNHETALMHDHQGNFPPNQDSRLIQNQRVHLPSHQDCRLSGNQTTQRDYVMPSYSSNHLATNQEAPPGIDSNPNRAIDQNASLSHHHGNQSTQLASTNHSSGDVSHKLPNYNQSTQASSIASGRNRQSIQDQHDHPNVHKESVVANKTSQEKTTDVISGVKTPSSCTTQVNGPIYPIKHADNGKQCNQIHHDGASQNSQQCKPQQGQFSPKNVNQSSTKPPVSVQGKPFFFLQENNSTHQSSSIQKSTSQSRMAANRMGPITNKLTDDIATNKKTEKVTEKVKGQEDVNLATGQSSGQHKCVKCGSGFQVKADLGMHLIVFHSTKKPNLNDEQIKQNQDLAKTQAKQKSIEANLKQKVDDILRLLPGDHKTKTSKGNIVKSTEQKPPDSSLKRTVDDILKMLPVKRRTGGSGGSVTKDDVTVRQVNVRFRCQICDIKFLTLVGFEEHRYTDHKCRTCETTFPNKEQLQRHKIIAHMCGACGHYFAKNESRKDHPCQDDICTICGERAESKDALRDHMTENHKCSGCRATFLRKTDLDKHRLEKHGHRCRICGYHFKWKDGLKQHMLMSHGLKCVTCKKRFKMKEDLDKHVLDNHKCDICGLFFKTSESLRKHKNFIHVCGVCGEVFKEREALSAHEYDKHKCSLCNEVFTSQQDLVLHRDSIHKCCFCAMKFDTKQEQDSHPCETYKCPCGANYPTEDELEAHSNGNHYCSYCDTFFLMKKEFANHRKTSHLCPLCDALFIFKANLDKHKETSHECIKCGNAPDYSGEETPTSCVCGGDFMKFKTESDDDKECQPSVDQNDSILKLALGAKDKHDTLKDSKECQPCADPIDTTNSCKNCPATFPDAPRLQQHEKSCMASQTNDLPILQGFATDIPGVLSCHLCEQQFEDRGPLTRHLRETHPEGSDEMNQINKETTKGKPCFKFESTVKTKSSDTKRNLTN